MPDAIQEGRSKIQDKTGITNNTNWPGRIQDGIAEDSSQKWISDYCPSDR